MRCHRHNPTRPGLATGLALLLSMSFAACGGGTGFQQTWSDPTAGGIELKKIGVVGVAADPAARTEFEDRFAWTLQKRGNDAIAGHTFIPEEMRGQLEKIKAAMVEKNIDGVLVTRLASAMSTPTGSVQLETVLENPATTDQDQVQLRTSLYRLSDGRLLWEAVTASDRSGSIKSDASAFSETVARDLYAQGWIR